MPTGEWAKVKRRFDSTCVYSPSTDAAKSTEALCDGGAWSSWKPFKDFMCASDDPRRTNALQTKWNCVPQKRGGEGDGLADSTGGSLPASDCSNFGFLDMPACQERCNKVANCEMANFDA